MAHGKVYGIGAVAVLGVLALWLLWATHGTEWQKYEALSALISGLALVGLVVTVAIQLSEIRSQGAATLATLAAQRHLTQVLALSAVRDLAGRRIDHLKKRIKDATTHVENMTPQQAEAQINTLSNETPGVDAELRRICVTLIPSMSALALSHSETPRNEA